MNRLQLLLLASALGAVGCNPFASDAPPVQIQTPPVVQLGPNGIQAPGVQVGPGGVVAPGVVVGPNGVVAPGVVVGPNGVMVPGAGIQVGQPAAGGGLPVPTSFGVAECDSYAARACNCNNAMMRGAMCQGATQSFASWSQMDGPARAGLGAGCAMAEQGIRGLCSQ